MDKITVESIVFRTSPAKISIQSLSFVVQEYIKEKKGVSVNIELAARIKPLHPLFKHFFTNEYYKLIAAFDIAAAYYIDKINKQKQSK